MSNLIYLSMASLLKIGSWDVEKRSRILPLAGGFGYIVSIGQRKHEAMAIIDQMDMHIHTNRSDGHPDLTVEVALRRFGEAGFRWIAFADHWSPDTNGAIFREQKQDVIDVHRRLGLDMNVFVSTEVDSINSAGELANERVGEYVDYISVAPNHYTLKWVESPTIGRLIDCQHETLLNLAKRKDVSVILHPWVDAIAYGWDTYELIDEVPTSYLDEFAQTAKQHNTAIEIHRGMELSYVRLVRALKAAGTRVTIGSDAHSFDGLVVGTESAKRLARLAKIEDDDLWLPGSTDQLPT